MRIHRIRLCNYRGIDEREVELAPIGVTVIEGPNEIGKSSIAESLNFLFEELDSTGKQAVKDTKPVGRDAGPEVEVELETGPYAFTYRKRFLRDRETVLQVTKPRAESLTGREAHERVREILDETLDESLWKALRITQGAAVGEVALGGIGSLSSALDAEAGTTPAGLGETALYDRARAEYLKYWTETGRAKAEAGTLHGDLADREEGLRAIEAALKDLEDDVDQVAHLNSEKDRLDERRADDEKRAVELRALWQRVEGIQKHVETLEAKDKAARLEAERAHKASADRDALIEKGAAGRDECDRLRLAMEEAAPVLESATERAAAATSGLGESRQIRHAAERSAKLLRGDVEHLRDEQTLATLGEHRVQLAEEREALIASEATLETNKVDEAALQSIREASTEAQMARARLEAGSPSVDIESLGADGLELDGKAITIEPGTTEHRSVIGQLRVEVPGSIRVDVSAGADGSNLTEALTEAESVLATACEAVGVEDLAEAQTLAT
ncbi:MAG: AAA family ATPase, partial [Chloroflexota bacterium]